MLYTSGIRDPEGKDRIFDTRWDLIEEGIFPEDSDLSFEEMKEALDNPCMVGSSNCRRIIKLEHEFTKITMTF